MVLASLNGKKPNGESEFVENTDIIAPGSIGIEDTLVSAQGEDKITGYTWYLCLVAGIAGFLFG